MLAQVAIAMTAASAVSGAVIMPRQQSNSSGSGRTPLSSPGAIGFSNPPIRGWTQETATVAPCGGYSLGGRTDWPVTGGQISLVQARDGHNIAVSYSTNPDPQSENDFQPLLPVVDHLYGGTFCAASPDFTSLGLASGSNITLRLTYQAGQARSTFSQCSDLTIVPQNQYVAANTVNCVNYTRSTQTRSGGNTALPNVESSASSSSSDGGLSLAEAGGIGAGVALAAAGIIAGLLFLSGLVSFGTKSKKSGTTVWKDNRDETVERDDSSTLASIHDHEKVVA